MSRKMQIVIDYETDGMDGLVDHGSMLNEIRRFFPFVARPYVLLISHSAKLLAYEKSEKSSSKVRMRVVSKSRKEQHHAPGQEDQGDLPPAGEGSGTGTRRSASARQRSR